MILLPIVDRELRVAARRKGAHRIRLWTTVAALVVSFLFMGIFRISGQPFQHLGRTLFTILTYYAFGLCLLAGVLLAADCLSEEKREGTLGLLFLTDLKGYDVVFGKLMAVGLSALYGLVAALPITGLPLLMGGVTGSEFWRMALALVNVLFFSLATGMLVSSWSRDGMKAMGNTLALLALAAVGAPLVGGSLARLGLPSGWWYWTSFSPYYPFTYASYAYAGRYWVSLLISHSFGWMLLLIANWSLPRTWQDRPFRARSRIAARRFNTINLVQGNWTAARYHLGDQNPIAWLMGGGKAMAWRIWLVAIAGAFVGLALAWVGWGLAFRRGLPSPPWFFGLLLKILFAMQACRFFVESRRSGALDLLLSTPITAREMVDGQWSGLKRHFLWPVVIFVGAQMVAFAWQFDRNYFRPQIWMFTLSGFAPYRAAAFIADLLALGWLGMWLGLTARKPTLAPALTILFVLVLPKFVFCAPQVLVDVGIILWSRNRLLNEFRRVAVPEYQPAAVGLAMRRFSGARATPGGHGVTIR